MSRVCVIYLILFFLSSSNGEMILFFRSNSMSDTGLLYMHYFSAAKRSKFSFSRSSPFSLCYCYKNSDRLTYSLVFRFSIYFPSFIGSAILLCSSIHPLRCDMFDMQYIMKLVILSSRNGLFSNKKWFVRLHENTNRVLMAHLISLYMCDSNANTSLFVSATNLLSLILFVRLFSILEFMLAAIWLSFMYMSYDLL